MNDWADEPTWPMDLPGGAARPATCSDCGSLNAYVIPEPGVFLCSRCFLERVNNSKKETSNGK